MDHFLFALKGLIVGLIIGFPSGPVGFIYIKRATTDGFWAGFVSGLGSTVAHLFYILALLYGYTGILTIFEDYQHTLSFIFSTFLIVLGIIIFCSSKREIGTDGDVENLYGFFLTAFGITITNPMVFVQLSFFFALLNVFATPSIEYAPLIAGILTGALFWPTITSFGISKIRHSIPGKRIEYLQKTIGIIILFIGLFFILKNFT